VAAGEEAQTTGEGLSWTGLGGRFHRRLPDSEKISIIRAVQEGGRLLTNEVFTHYQQRVRASA
jgi:hypothetical protein